MAVASRRVDETQPMDEPWYGVRTVFEHPDEDPSSGERWYEERITLWRAASADEALERAEAEAGGYAERHGCEDTGVVQVFHIAGAEVGAGTEVFSLIRSSRLGPDQYLDAHFDTGTEIQRDASDQDD